MHKMRPFGGSATNGMALLRVIRMNIAHFGHSRAFDAMDILEHLAPRRTTEIQQFVVRVDCCQWCQGNIGELGRNNTLEDARSIDG